jgi:nucleoside-diphosphate-sugar epimerase
VGHLGNGLGPILLTGASGYLGQRVLARASAARLTCVATSHRGNAGEACDLTDSLAVASLLERVQPSAIVHCAALVPNIAAGYDDGDSAEASLAMVKNIARHARCRMVLVSSMTVYGGAYGLPVEEDGVSPPTAKYALGKWQAEEVLLKRDFHGDVILRLPGLFGFPRRSGLLYNAARSFLTGTQFELNDASGIWASMNVDDASEYLVRAATDSTRQPVQAVNIGYDGSFSKAAAVSAIAKHCAVEWSHPASLYQYFFAMDLRRLKSRYGMLRAGFSQRLQEFVRAIDADLKTK